MGYIGRMIISRGKALAAVPQRVYGTLRGFHYIYQLHKHPECIYFVAPYGIGDTLMLAGLMREYKKLNHIGKICFVVKNSHRDLAAMFDAVDEVIADDKMVKYLKAFAVNMRKFVFANFRYGHFILEFGWPEPGLMMGVKGVSLLDVYKRAVLNLPLDTKVESPKLFMDKKEIEKFAEKYPADRRVAVLMPYAVTIENLDPAFWEKIAAELNRKGYTVYTNIIKDTEPVIPGTEGMILSLKELYCLASVNKWACVALRSGICDLLAFSEIRTVVIHDSQLAYDVWNIKNLELFNPNVTEVILDEDNDRTVREIVDGL